MTQHQRSPSADTQARYRRAYAIVKWLAIESGHMSNRNDVAGFEAWCDEFEAMNNREYLLDPILPANCREDE
jgi:hypothetical protein